MSSPNIYVSKEPLSVERNGSRAIVALVGEIDLAQAPQLRSLLFDLAAETTDVVVDLHDTTFVDSTTIGVMINALRRFEERNASLVLRSPRPSVERVLELTGVTGLIPIDWKGT